MKIQLNRQKVFDTFRTVHNFNDYREVFGDPQHLCCMNAAGLAEPHFSPDNPMTPVLRPPMVKNLISPGSEHPQPSFIRSPRTACRQRWT